MLCIQAQTHTEKHLPAPSRPRHTRRWIPDPSALARCWRHLCVELCSARVSHYLSCDDRCVSICASISYLFVGTCQIQAHMEYTYLHMLTKYVCLFIYIYMNTQACIYWRAKIFKIPVCKFSHSNGPFPTHTKEFTPIYTHKEKLIHKIYTQWILFSQRSTKQVMLLSLTNTPRSTSYTCTHKYYMHIHLFRHAQNGSSPRPYQMTPNTN